MTPTYAIVESGGKQYRAEKGDSLVVDRLPEEQGAKVALRAVMYRADNNVVVEADELRKVKVEAVVAEHLRGPKVRVFKYKPKKGYRRRAGHRSELTKLDVKDVRLLQRKPAEKKREQKRDKPASGKRTRAEKKPAEKKSAARRSKKDKKEG